MGIGWYIAGAIIIAFILGTIDSMFNGAVLTFWGGTRCKVRILYKSGNSIEGWFSKFEITRKSDGALSGITWNGYDNSEFPLVIGAIGDIEAVWQLEARISFWRIFPWVQKY